ncbi:MAG: TIGR03619 family F420-dependent LLM class oxidoreductase [Actinomycetia bacterium]|nr:TIGR03619 family F420-dependent LLM class oxidoreductase [Actinomycetes bacterium]MCP4225283.1 TIGR03619 family F420-dependent LLM class oxidoreductase [Actinomycetes bacterium]MCP5033016.1 TIGR03619 family F420-dependent LLM class oxidoreductase [Actinomycetes bacterium]
MDVSIVGMFGNSPRRDHGFIRDFAQTAENLGYHALFAPEHVVFFPSYESKYPYTEDGSANWGPETGIYDPLFVCQVAAQATTTLRFCTGVLILPQRPALLTAKEVLTLDHFTGGRFELGVGSGWSWEEYGALGVPFERRGKRLDEYIEAIRLSWTEDRASYRGEFVEFADVVLNPKPLTPGGPPIIIGGSAPAAMRRAARMGDGWYGWWARVDIEAHLDEVRTIMANHGRSVDDEDFSFKLGLPIGSESPDEVAAMADQARQLGVDEFVMAAPITTSGFVEGLTTYGQACGLLA